jgi:ABC-type polysaccharide/polyol phosphate transport system ATPase subunit
MNDATPIGVKLINASVEFPVYHTKSRSLKDKLISVGTGGIIKHESNNVLTIKALNEITIDINKGDRLAIIGRNGSGKSTLLRVIAGIYPPTSGDVYVKGRVVPLLDVGFGLDDECTGIENLILRGMLLGLSSKEIHNKIDDIIEFTELGEYINLPLHTYSAGMEARLALGVSTCVNPDILLIDESISVGDVFFVEKAQNRVNELIERSGMLVLVSHSEELIHQMCNRAALVHRGNLLKIGQVDEVLDTYHSQIV